MREQRHIVTQPQEHLRPRSESFHFLHLLFTILIQSRSTSLCMRTAQHKHTSITSKAWLHQQIYHPICPLRDMPLLFLIAPVPTTSEEKYGCKHQFGS